MYKNAKLPFITLMLLISFASVNAVLITPALPSIAQFFQISASGAQLIVTWFLIGYALGQLLYGPLANRFGRKAALLMGVGLQIVSSVLCILASNYENYTWLVIARFLLALGSGVGLKITFTLISENYDAVAASQKISYLMIAFAVTPGLGIAIGGFLTEHMGWISCFYAEAIYGLCVLYLVTKLPETQTTLDLNALKFKHLTHEYISQFKNSYLIAGAFLMGCGTAIVYAFAAVAPFVVIKLFHVNSSTYGFYNLLPPVGLIAGSLFSAYLVKKMAMLKVIQLGIEIALLGMIFMLLAVTKSFPVVISIFAAMTIIYFGLSLVLANASTLAMKHATDKAHGSAVMNFINMGLATAIVLGLGFFSITPYVLPVLFIVLSMLMIFLLKMVFD